MPAYTIDEIIALPKGTNPHYAYLLAGWQIVKQIQADVGALTAGGTPGWAAAIDTRWSLTDTGAADAYAATPNPAPDPSDSISTGQWCFLKPANTNTGASTFDVGTTEGTVAIKKNGGTALSAGDIVANKPAILYYTGTVWELVNPAAASADVSGPASSTDNAIARMDGTGGKTIQNSGVTVDDDGNVAGHGITHKTVSATTYTILGSDKGKVVRFTNASGCAVTIPETATESIAAGFECGVVRASGAGSITFSTEGTDTLESTDSNTGLRAVGSPALLTKITAGSPNAWGLYGDLV